MDRLDQEPDPSRRRLIALGLLSDRLAEDGIEPILVGGGAVEFYTAGGYTTKDIDLAMPHGPATDAAFAELGFTKEDRYWYREDLDLLFEAPAPAGLPGETAPRQIVAIEGLRIVVLGIEDLVIDRLRCWIHGSSDEDGRWARRLAMLYADTIDWAYLRDKTRGVTAEAEALEALATEALSDEELR